MRSKNLVLTASLYLLMFAYGLSVTMLGPLMPILIQQYNLKLSQGGLILTFQSIGGIAAIILGGILADLTKKSKLLCAAFVIYSLSLFFIALSPSYILLLSLFFILGASTRMLDAVINAYISDLHADNRGFYLTLLHALFGVGAFIGPLFSTVFINAGVAWNRTFLFLGIVCAVIAVQYIVVLIRPAAEEKSVSPSESKDYLRLLTSPKMLVLCLIMFLYSGHQSGISAWLPMYMEQHLKTGTFLSGFAVSAFWVGIILGRFGCSLVSSKIHAKYLIMFGSLAGGSILTLATALNVPVLLVAASGLAGLLAGATIPLLVTTACNWYPKNSGTVSSMIFLYGTFAWMLFPWFIGVIAENISFRWGMMITGFSLLSVTALTLLLPAQKNRN